MNTLQHLFNFIIRFLAVWLVDTISLLVTAWIIPGINFIPEGNISVFVIAIVAALIIVREQFGDTARLVIAYAIPFVALTLAFLMVSRIPYKRFYRAYLLGKKPFGQLVGFLLILVVFFVYKAATLLLVVLWYGASGPIDALLRRMRKLSTPGDTTAVDNAGQEERKTA